VTSEELVAMQSRVNRLNFMIENSVYAVGGRVEGGGSRSDDRIPVGLIGCHYSVPPARRTEFERRA